MKISIVCPRLCHGGAERVAVSLANGFVGRGHEVVVVADLYEEQTFQLDSRIVVENLVPNTSNKLKKWIGAIFYVHKHIKKCKPDVIIGIMSLCSVVSWLASLGTNVPVIATEHNAFERPGEVKLSFLERLYKFYICKIYRCVTVLAQSDKVLIGNRAKSVVVMPNPLSIEIVENLPEKKNFVLACGRVDNWYCKGFDVLIKAWARVVSGSEFLVSSGGWKLVIAGVWRNPETRIYLDGIAKECGVLDSIEYTGFVEDMQKLYADSSIFVLSSRYEGFGLVLIEAMSQGCACVACDYKGRQREIISPTPASSFSDGLRKRPVAERPRREGEPSIESQSLGTRNSKPETRNYKFEACENGILCEPDDVEALATGIQKMITDDEYRENVRANAIERSKYYSIENTMDRWEDLFSQIVKN